MPPGPRRRHCVRPYHDTTTANVGGPHTHGNASPDINAGKMDGFVVEARARRAKCASDRPPLVLTAPEAARRDGLSRRARDPELLELRPQLRAPGPHVRARRVLEPAAHLFMVSGWSAYVHEARRPDELPERGARAPARRPRSSVTADRHRARLTPGPTSPICCTARSQLALLRRDRAPSPTATTTRSVCTPVPQTPRRRASGTRCRLRRRCSQDEQLGNVQALEHFYARRQRTARSPRSRGSMPDGSDSEHPPAASPPARRT